MAPRESPAGEAGWDAPAPIQRAPADARRHEARRHSRCSTFRPERPPGSAGVDVRQRLLSKLVEGARRGLHAPRAPVISSGPARSWVTSSSQPCT